MNGLQKTLTLLGLVVFTAISTPTTAQDEGFIYGRITTIDGGTYEGALRWGKEEVYWTDMFNARKTENENLDLLSREELEYLEDRDRNQWASRRNDWVDFRWEWNDDDFIHQFVIQFGEMKSIRPRGRDWVDIRMQNGDLLKIDGGSTNDVGRKVRVYDSELGSIEIDFDRIELIEFMNTPRKLSKKFGEPLFGTVESDLGSFTGFIQWDHDERVSTDVLDGDTYDGDVSIEFGNIRSIERMGYSRSLVTLNSGRELELRGSNDVNDDNKGIIVTIDGVGRIDLEWEDFDKVTFSEAPNSGPSYGSFKNQEKLSGSVTTTNGDNHSGRIVFDVDEAWNYEMLDGNDDDTEFVIPFRNVVTVSPKNYAYSNVTLKNGQKILLGDTHDVSDENNGIIVIDGSETIYVPWDRVEEVEFR